MKTAHALAGCCALLGAAILAARADTNATPPSLPPATPTTPAVPAAAAPVPATTEPIKGLSTPTVQSFPLAPQNLPSYDPADLGTDDPERIAEQTYLFNQQKQKTSDNVDLDQAARQRAYDNDWMLRGYAEQLKKRGLGDSREVDSALVAAPVDPNAPKAGEAAPDSLLPQEDADRKKAAARRHAQALLASSDFLTPKKSLAAAAYQPLLKPFDEVTVNKPSDPWGTSSFDADLTDLDTSSGATLLPVPGTIPDGISRRDNPEAGYETSLLDIPGLTAATQGEIAPNNALTFQDPGENETTDRQHPRTSSSNSNNNFLIPTAPSNDITDFFKKQAIALQPPTAPNAATALVTPGRPTLPLTPAPPSKPSSQAGMGMRLHVDDPFDILRR